MSLNYPSDEPALSVWVRLADQLDRLQVTVDELLASGQETEAQVTALVRHLTNPDDGRALDERLADLAAAQEAGQAQSAALAGSLNELSQVVAKLSRTQFKANTLAEMKEQQVSTALGALQEVAVRREEAQAERSTRGVERDDALRAAGRRELAADLLPSLDGLEMALESGRALVARQAAAAAAAPPALQAERRASVMERLRYGFGGRPHEAAPLQPVQPTGMAPDDVVVALESWLQGLELVRARFLALLGTADIYPIEAEGQFFDPRRHHAVAVEAHPGAPVNLVLRVVRQGYRQGDRVLRYAEVVVNRAATGVAGAGDAVERLPEGGNA